MDRRVIGPFIGLSFENKFKIIIGLPNHLEITSLKCEFSSDISNEVCIESPKDSKFNNYQFYVPEKFNGMRVSYKFSTNDGDLDLGGGLSGSDCYFDYKVGFESEDDYFVLLSCNNPFEAERAGIKKGVGSPWAMWEKLDEIVLDGNCKLLLLGGDQVYCDDLEKGITAPPALSLKGADEETLRKDFINQYLKYWGNISLRKVWARIPSLAMWDDHDITDGWGSRGEFLKKDKTIKESMAIYFGAAKEAFMAYQAIRNPSVINGLQSNLTCHIDIGSKRFYLVDFRSERNSARQQLWKEETEKIILEHIDVTGEEIENIYFLSPVIGLRTNFEDDKRMSFISKILFNLAIYRKEYPLRYSLGGYIPVGLIITLAILLQFSDFNTFLYELVNIPIGKWFLKAISVGLFVLSSGILILQFGFSFLVKSEITGIGDDIADALSSESNISSFKKILKSLFRQTYKGKRCFILSGDIHAGGFSEFLEINGEKTNHIPQIVASPIAYPPMPKAVEGLTTTTSEMIYDKSGTTILGRNLFYMSKRNFAKIYPNRKVKDLEFFFEGHSQSVLLNTSTTRG